MGESGARSCHHSFLRLFDAAALGVAGGLPAELSELASAPETISSADFATSSTARVDSSIFAGKWVLIDTRCFSSAYSHRTHTDHHIRHIRDYAHVMWIYAFTHST